MWERPSSLWWEIGGMEGEAGVVRRLYDAVLAERDLRRIERRVGFIRLPTR